MIFEHHALPATLGERIEAIIYFKDFIPEHTIERVVPTGHIFLIFEFDNITRMTFDNASLKPLKHYSKVWISGMHRNFISISVHELSEMLVIQFKPAGSYPFLHVPVQDLNEKIVAAEKILGQEILDLRNELLKAKNSKTKFGKIEKWLMNRLDPKKIPSKALVDLINRLQRDPVSNLKTIIKTYPYTQKQLIQHFKKYVGLTPKYYHRIVRFNEILHNIHTQEVVSGADLAYSCGYSDQSHFIKEFCLFSGFNPREFVKKAFPKDEKNFFPLNKKG